ncbi:5'-nucleotidase C-terminal domain-containing protein [Sphaerospermopsis sp. LEGE 08334]|uniref:5'-nucleotidase C-terminal domain-containing protein n=1 Tax=Sphaerospermopsis sp. LEGE 08334 TaxID=1828651 RepID=UPI00187F909B|nr:5'-nucleotidase C-terminal domain-containing protein [Sphaerospermopsis sp. LEGE 08334]MBE9056597.1 5'-nucleotidase C-terminal domain-containing protein [Sphaerospermopsis sp. LEGE 08334]
MTSFRLQILHASDLEGGVNAISDAPNFAAIVDSLENLVDHSITLSAGDNYIAGPFFSAAGDITFRNNGLFNDVYNQLFGLPNASISDVYGSLREGSGRVDISIMNIIGFDASALGNHEFDLGSEVIRTIISPEFRGAGLGDDRWVGTQFPYLSANLDFSADSNLSGLFTPDILLNTAFKTDPTASLAGTTTPKIAPATIIERGGEQIGVVGATTQLLESISSPTGTTVKGINSNDMDALAAILQPVIDQLQNQGINKIIVVSHLQQIALEQELITKLRGVDVVVAGGSDTILANDDDILRLGDVPANTYPIVTTNADGDPAVIVSTDGEYSYVGRLVVDFNTNGILVDANGNPIDEVSDLDLSINGPVTTTDENVIALWGSIETAFAEGTKGNLVKQLTDAVAGLVGVQDGNVFGRTEVFIEGRREQVRTQETTLGNLSADANLSFAQTIDPTVQVSIKNGGGIRAAIGEVDQFGTLLPPQANPISGKKAGEISQLDILNSLRFNNGLSLLTVTAAELEQILEYGVAATAEGATPGQFPQVGGIKFSFDPSQQAIAFTRDANGMVTGIQTDGDRIRSLAIVNPENDQILDVIVENGQLVGDPNRQIRLVTLDFLASGGDNYPFPVFGENRVNLTQAADAPRTGVATFAADGSEQDTLAEFFAQNFPIGGNIAFNMIETSPEEDTRIQNLNFREDTVLNNAAQTLVFATPGNDTLIGGIDFDAIRDIVFTGAGNDEVDVPFAGSRAGDNRVFTGSGADIIYAGNSDRSFGGSGDDTLDATEATGYRLSGGAGNDTFYLGANGRALGGDGDDKFFVQEGGNNIISGGAGADQFWIVNGDLPATANTILDFAMGIDVLGIAGQGANFGFDDLTLSGNSIIINGTTVAVLNGVNTANLTADHFAFV